MNLISLLKQSSCTWAIIVAGIVMNCFAIDIFIVVGLVNCFEMGVFFVGGVMNCFEITGIFIVAGVVNCFEIIGILLPNFLA